MLSITEGSNEGKSQVIASCKYLKEKLWECSKREGVVMAESAETLRDGPGNTIQTAGSERGSEKENGSSRKITRGQDWEIC